MHERTRLVILEAAHRRLFLVPTGVGEEREKKSRKNRGKKRKKRKEKVPPPSGIITSLFTYFCFSEFCNQYSYHLCFPTYISRNAIWLPIHSEESSLSGAIRSRANQQSCTQLCPTPTHPIESRDIIDSHLHTSHLFLITLPRHFQVTFWLCVVLASNSQIHFGSILGLQSKFSFSFSFPYWDT